MIRKFYISPSVTKVVLEVKNSVLATCHMSSATTPQQETITCKVTLCSTPL